jgi:hypothetical protein
MKRLLALGVLSGLLLAGCGGGGGDVAVAPPPPTAAVYEPTAISQWNDVALEAVRNGTLGPPAVARALAMVHTSTFDAWAAFDAKAVPVAPGAPAKQPAAQWTETSKSTAIAMAAYRTLLNLYPAQKDRFDTALKARGLLPEATSTTDGTAAAVGNAAAAAVIAMRANDGANQENNYADTSGYVPVNTATQLTDVSAWQPQAFCNGRTPGFLLPHWGAVRPFALSSGAQFRPKGPAKMGEAKFMQQALDVLALSAGLDDRQKVISDYWADGPASETPPGHWYLFAKEAAKQYRHTLDQDAMLFMAMGNAMLDASIATWDAKRAYDSARPISAIRTLFKGQDIRAWAQGKGTVAMKGEEWLPFQPCSFLTPPFPEYTSGHSAFSAAGAEVLKRFTGSDATTYSATVAAGTCKADNTVPKEAITLKWATFTEAADEAGMSRRYGGIHFEDGDLDARALGRKVADAVYKKAQTHFGR